MAHKDISKETQEPQLDEWIKEPVHEKLSQLTEQIEQITQADTDVSEVAVANSFMPDIKGLELLQEGTYAVDLEKTFTDMFSIIKNMENQLTRLLSINTHLEKELKDSKEIIVDLNAQKAQLEKTIVRMEEESPSIRELQIEIDHLIEERTRAQNTIRELKLELRRMNEAEGHYRKKVRSLEEERKDAIMEIHYFESMLDATVNKISWYERNINILKGENVSNIEKMDYLEKEKNRLIKELEETKLAMDEVSYSLDEGKSRMKKSTYKTGAD